MLDGLAEAMRWRSEAVHAARSSGAGARLSGQIVAGLPLILLVLSPAARAPLFDPMGISLAAIGAGLALGGMIWIARLTPRLPDADEPVALAADLVAAIASGGGSLHGALRAVATHPPEELRISLARAQRLVALGASWSDALDRCGHAGLSQVSATLRRAERMGVPAAGSLRALARHRRTELRLDFEASTRRAPVLMAMPLAVCVLPSYVLLGLAPFLRSLSL
jgi:tight adherence protein B